MGRRETEVDPAAGPVALFAHDLRELRRAAGSPSYREMAGQVHYAGTTLSVAASGRALPSLAVTLAYVNACSGDLETWRLRWHTVAHQLAVGTPAPAAPESAESAVSPPNVSEPPARTGACPDDVRTTDWSHGVRTDDWSHGVRTDACSDGVRTDACSDGVRTSDWSHGVRTSDPGDGGGAGAGPAVAGRRLTVRFGLRPRHRRRWAAAAGAVVLALLIVLNGARPNAPSKAGAGASFPPPTASAALPNGVVADGVLADGTVGSDCPSGIGAVRPFVVAAPAWSVGTTGGWTGDHCYGEYLFLQPAAHGPTANHVEWTMDHLPAGPMDCLLSVHVPNSSHAAGSGRYDLAERADGDQRLLDTTRIDQGRHRGDWVGLGPYRVTGGWLRLDMHPAGPGGVDVTASAVHLRCTRVGDL